MLIFGLCLSCFLRDYQVTLFCREFQYWRIYAFFVLIFGVEKCACAVFHAFCMSVHQHYDDGDDDDDFKNHGMLMLMLDL